MEEMRFVKDTGLGCKSDTVTHVKEFRFIQRSGLLREVGVFLV